ncbi:hypothetical protein ncot_14745 [Nocardioides sp. JQ2195]|uniref:hypothetical protein n=1 Tax=Nocardioides sp. JQ2195 TaxID=2592334 RepID=UPI00143E672A|nr:hypothetical protein [Nocardioides sp. JQ2195]QIX27713.1 hypothetical protein ncot_14745 [Nocardioides sp. JQ2195]
MPRLAAAFAAAIATRDRARLIALLDDSIDFRAMTPRRIWEAHTPAGVAAIVLDNWFEEQDHIADVQMGEVEIIVDILRMTYQFDLETPSGEQRVEQTGYYRNLDGKIVWLRILCSGFRPLPEEPPAD